MIVLVSKYNPATGEIEQTRRDLTTAECIDIIHEYNPAQISCTTLPYNPNRPGSEFYKVRAAALCRKKDPIVLEAQGTGTKYAFRGTVICCGVGPNGKDTDVRKDFLANEYPIEPAYQEDTIYIPSLAEWLEIPKRTREILTGGLWCWSRDAEDTLAITISIDGKNGYCAKNSGAGGIVSFVDLRRLPSDVADKIRAREMHITRPHTEELLEETVCFERGDHPFTMVKITEDVYGISAQDRCEIFRNTPDLGNIDDNAKKTYEESKLRAYLNGEYLKQLIKYIRKH